MDKVRGKADRLFAAHSAICVVRRELVELREQADGQRVIAGVAAFVFLKPAFLVLPLEHPREPLAPLSSSQRSLREKPPHILEAQDDQRLVIRQPAALVVIGEPVGALAEEVEHLVVVQAEQLVAFQAGEQRKRRRARGLFKGKIIVARAVGMRAASGVKDPGRYPFLDRGDC